MERLWRGMIQSSALVVSGVVLSFPIVALTYYLSPGDAGYALIATSSIILYVGLESFNQTNPIEEELDFSEYSKAERKVLSTFLLIIALLNVSSKIGIATVAAVALSIWSIPLYALMAAILYPIADRYIMGIRWYLSPAAIITGGITHGLVWAYNSWKSSKKLSEDTFKRQNRQLPF